jgi:hypothetical protein
MNLSSLLRVDRTELARAISQLARAPEEESPDDVALRVGVHITNRGDCSINLIDTAGGRIRLEAERTIALLPVQFDVHPLSPESPYVTAGLVPNCFIALRFETEHESGLVELDWTRIFENAGVWGNMRLVARTHTSRGMIVEPVRSLKTILELGKDRSAIEIVGLGLGLDMLTEAAAMRREKP